MKYVDEFGRKKSEFGRKIKKLNFHWTKQNLDKDAKIVTNNTHINGVIALFLRQKKWWKYDKGNDKILFYLATIFNIRRNFI